MNNCILCCVSGFLVDVKNFKQKLTFKCQNYEHVGYLIIVSYSYASYCTRFDNLLTLLPNSLFDKFSIFA